jgi:hypothetical protein
MFRRASGSTPRKKLPSRSAGERCAPVAFLLSLALAALTVGPAEHAPGPSLAAVYGDGGFASTPSLDRFRQKVSLPLWTFACRGCHRRFDV